MNLALTAGSEIARNRFGVLPEIDPSRKAVPVDRFAVAKKMSEFFVHCPIVLRTNTKHPEVPEVVTGFESELIPRSARSYPEVTTKSVRGVCPKRFRIARNISGTSSGYREVPSRRGLLVFLSMPLPLAR